MKTLGIPPTEETVRKILQQPHLKVGLPDLKVGYLPEFSDRLGRGWYSPQGFHSLSA